jgi:hypothetical protein
MLLPSVLTFWIVSAQFVPEPVIRGSARSDDFAEASGTATSVTARTAMATRL